jgi:hypothetical protein
MQPLVVGFLTGCRFSHRASVDQSKLAWAAGHQPGREGDSGLMFWGLLACVAGVIIGGARTTAPHGRDLEGADRCGARPGPSNSLGGLGRECGGGVLGPRQRR